jgi:hypothetical protein
MLSRRPMRATASRETMVKNTPYGVFQSSKGVTPKMKKNYDILMITLSRPFEVASPTSP